MFTQLITPTPVIPAKEGMCLQYVRQTFGLPARYDSATDAWNASTTKHRADANGNRNYPKGVWFPVWWALDKNVNGHVALVAPDGRVYSTSNLDPNPLKVHPNVADVEAYYAKYGFTLTYRGWTEDVAGTPVITGDGSAAIAPESSTTPTTGKDWFDMASKQDLQDAVYDELMAPRSQQAIKDAINAELGSRRGIVKLQTAIWTQVGGERSGKLVSMWRDMVDTNTIVRSVLAAVQELAKKSGSTVTAIDPDAVVDALAARLDKSAGAGK